MTASTGNIKPCTIISVVLSTSLYLFRAEETEFQNSQLQNTTQSKLRLLYLKEIVRIDLNIRSVYWSTDAM
jgi:hypothetical protein